MHLRRGSESLGEPPSPLNYFVLRSLQDSKRRILQRVIAARDDGSHPHFLRQTGRIFAINRCSTPGPAGSMGLAYSASHLHPPYQSIAQSPFRTPSGPLSRTGSDTPSGLNPRYHCSTSCIQPRIDGVASIDLSLFAPLPPP